METTTIILNGAPYGDEKTWNGIRIAQTLVSASIKMKVHIFLLGDAVGAAKKGQNPPEGYYNLEKMLKELADHGAEILACRTCIHARGMTETDLVQGVNVGTMMNLAQWIEQSQKVLSF